MNYCKIICVGNLTRDPDVRYSTKGSAICTFGMAVNRSWKSESGESKKEVTFLDLKAFGRQAEVISQYVKKGSSLLVEGRLKQEDWEDKQTHQKRSKLVVIVEQFQFGHKDTQDPQKSAESPQSDAPTDDDVPF